MEVLRSEAEGNKEIAMDLIVSESAAKYRWWSAVRRGYAIASTEAETPISWLVR
jgi:hypothetical protein